MRPSGQSTQIINANSYVILTLKDEIIGSPKGDLENLVDARTKERMIVDVEAVI